VRRRGRSGEFEGIPAKVKTVNGRLNSSSIKIRIGAYKPTQTARMLRQREGFSWGRNSVTIPVLAIRAEPRDSAFTTGEGVNDTRAFITRSGRLEGCEITLVSPRGGAGNQKSGVRRGRRLTVKSVGYRPTWLIQTS